MVQQIFRDFRKVFVRYCHDIYVRQEIRMDVCHDVRPECSLTTAVACKDAVCVRYDVQLAFGDVEDCSECLKMFDYVR